VHHDNDDRAKAIIDSLSSLIRSHGQVLARELYAPGANPDVSDETIADEEKFITRLRAIRAEFENLLLGID